MQKEDNKEGFPLVVQKSIIIVAFLISMYHYYKYNSIFFLLFLIFWVAHSEIFYSKFVQSVHHFQIYNIPHVFTMTNWGLKSIEQS